MACSFALTNALLDSDAIIDDYFHPVFLSSNGLYSIRKLFFNGHPTSHVHLFCKIFGADLFDTVDAFAAFGTCDKPDDLCENIVIFLALFQKRYTAVGASGIIVFTAAFAYFAPGGLFIFVTPSAFPFFQAFTLSAVKPAIRDVIVFHIICIKG